KGGINTPYPLWKESCGTITTALIARLESEIKCASWHKQEPRSPLSLSLRFQEDSVGSRFASLTVPPLGDTSRSIRDGMSLRQLPKMTASSSMNGCKRWF